MQQSLAQIFNETAATVHSAFPDKLKNLVILLCPSSETPVYVSPEIADLLTNNIAAVKQAVKKETNYMHTRNAAGIAYRSYPLAKTAVKLIALEEDVRGIFSLGNTKEMRVIYVLDHEIGHHVVKSGYPSSPSGVSLHRAECAADAYGILRHIQRFGKNTPFSRITAMRKAGSIVLFADVAHYTTDLIQAIIRLSETEKVSTLSLQETAALAEKIASECLLTGQVLEKIRAAFLPVHNACKEHIGSMWEVTEKLHQEDRGAYAFFLHKTLAVMRQHQSDPDIFKAGQRFLTAYPAMKTFMAEWAKTDGYWKEALSFIEKAPATPPAPAKSVSLI